MPNIFYYFSWILIGKWNTNQDPDKDPRIKFCLLAKRKRILWDPDPKQGFLFNELISNIFNNCLQLSKIVQSYRNNMLKYTYKQCILSRTVKLLNYTIRYLLHTVYNVMYIYKYCISSITCVHITSTSTSIVKQRIYSLHNIISLHSWCVIC